MTVSTPTNTGMYTGYAGNASFGTLHMGVEQYGLQVQVEEIGMSYIGNTTSVWYEGSYAPSDDYLRGVSDLDEVSLGYWEKVPDFAEAFVAVRQLGMFDARLSMPIMDRIGNYSKFAAQYQSLSRLGTSLGYVNKGLAIYSTYKDYNDPQVSTALFAYRTSGIGASIGASALIGTEFGGPWGTLAGFLVGSGFVAGEAANDLWNRSVLAISNFSMNFNGYIR